MKTDPLLIGIDGGGTKSRAWLARLGAGGEPVVLGRGTGGPANPQAVGFPAALKNLDAAIAAAFADAKLRPAPAAAAVLAAAGSDREENRAAFLRWANDSRLADRFRIVHDALPVLSAGCPSGWGIALIAGTGSLAYGRAPDGRTARAGGWGFLFGDEGSAYAIALTGLRAAAQAADGRTPPTQMAAAFIERLRIARAEELIPAVYAIQSDRAALAALATVVTQTAAQGDAAAQRILDESAADLAAMVAAVARKLDFASLPFQLALTGGVLLDSADLRDRLRAALIASGCAEIAPALVAEPVRGALQLALAEYRNASG